MVRSGRIAPAAEAQRVVGTAKHTGEVAISALVDVSGVAGTAPLLSEPIATICRARGVSDNGSCFRGQTYQTAFAGEDPLLRHVRSRARSPPTNSVIERFFGTLKFEHLYRAPIDDGGALAVETARFRGIYNRVRPHQALGDRAPRQAYLDT